MRHQEYVMSKVLGWAVAALAIVIANAAQSQQQPAAQVNRADPSWAWAFPLKPDRGLPEDPSLKSLPGSALKRTQPQIDDLLNPPDWYPDQHPAPPQIVVHGHGAALACGACHLMSGLGHPESSDLIGLSPDYVIQQMADFRTGARKDPTRMNSIAKEVTEEEARQAAQWFAALPRRAFTKVIETETVPKTFLGPGRMRFAEPGGSREPIGNRIITLPQDQTRARLRDPHSGFIAYVPVGSIARGRSLVEDGSLRTIACGLCHGPSMRGQGKVPRIAGTHPIYTVRQLYGFKDGSRNGPDAALMKPIVAQLTDEDIVAIAAYLGSLAP
jgi:cytochrome c553